MSAYGPALFIARNDRHEIPETEQDELLGMVVAAARELRLKDDDGNPVMPTPYDYGTLEEKTLGILLYSSYAYAEMPPDLQEDEDEAYEKMGLKIGKRLNKEMPGRYTVRCHAVED